MATQAVLPAIDSEQTIPEWQDALDLINDGGRAMVFQVDLNWA